MVQNKIHYAAHGHTAAEIVASRADAELPFMGMTTFSKTQPLKHEISIAKNYLDENELATLNRMVSAFFELAELQAMNHRPMYMKDWIKELDDFAERYGKGILDNRGPVSHEAAMKKVQGEYEKCRRKTLDELSPVERDFLTAIKSAQKKLEGKTDKKVKDSQGSE